MNIDTSKYQMNIIITDPESLVKNRALEEASIPDSLVGFIIRPSSASGTSTNAENGGNSASSDNNNAE